MKRVKTVLDRKAETTDVNKVSARVRKKRNKLAKYYGLFY